MTDHFATDGGDGLYRESTPDADRLERLAVALDGFAVVADATYVPDDPGGPTVECTLERWADGLPPILPEVAEQFGARVRRMEPRGRGLPDHLLIR